VWTEAGILLLAIVGSIRVWKERFITDDDAVTFRLITAIATLLMVLIISALPYKTPWVMLSAWLGLIILAGSGMEWLIGEAGRMRPLLYVVAGVMVLHLGWQAHQATVTYADDPRNPYVYAQAGHDVVAIGREVADLAKASQGSLSVVVCYEDGQYWPMPWYLRTVARTGWWNTVPDTLPSADIVLVSPELEPALIHALYETARPGERQLYVPLFDHPMYVRPGKELRVYATLELRDRAAIGGKR
jgi:predicted membrane-bound mannosyltransferase